MQPRRANVNEPGHAHELTFSCYRKLPLLRAERTCQWLAEAIDAARQSHGFLVWGYVFMPDHVHLIIYPKSHPYDIANIRKAIKRPVGRTAIAYLKENAPQWLPNLTRQRGSKTERLFWQSGGGYDRNVLEKRALFSMLDYVHANPVRKKLVEKSTEWKWSSALWYERMGQGPLKVDPIPANWLD